MPTGYVFFTLSLPLSLSCLFSYLLDVYVRTCMYYIVYTYGVFVKYVLSLAVVRETDAGKFQFVDDANALCMKFACSTVPRLVAL